jgi:hypothetical protein
MVVDFDVNGAPDPNCIEHNQIPASEPETVEFPGAGITFGKGRTFLEEFGDDPHAKERATNLYYPFASKGEWELASFLLLSNMSMANITKFLSLKLVSTIVVAS